MNALEAGFGFTITNCERSLSLREGEHIRMYPTGNNEGFGEELTKRQVDLLRIATAVHVADGWVRRQAILNGVRSPVLDIEVLDAPFWSQPGTMTLLKACVDFLSGGDDWNFRFLTVTSSRHQRRNDLFRGYDLSAITSLYSGGLDSAAGLATRLAMEPGRMMIPVTVRHQMQKAKLVREHFRMLLEKKLVTRQDLKPFQAGAFVRNVRIKHEFGEKFREITHRCRPMLFMVVAGLVADTFSTHEVEVYESGVGSINLPLGNGPADFRTTRTTHPHFLRLMGALVSHVNDSAMKYVLPFADHTKAEMVARLKKQGLEALARSSISCITHPYRRNGWQQCGHCPACVYRRQSMMAGGISEAVDAYGVDLFQKADPFHEIPMKQLRPIRAFHQQAARLAELDSGRIPQNLRQYLYATHVVTTDAQIAPYAEVYRRYRREWIPLIAEARRQGVPWIGNARSLEYAQGATI